MVFPILISPSFKQAIHFGNMPDPSKEIAAILLGETQNLPAQKSWHNWADAFKALGTVIPKNTSTSQRYIKVITVAKALNVSPETIIGIVIKLQKIQDEKFSNCPIIYYSSNSMLPIEDVTYTVSGYGVKLLAYLNRLA